MSKVTGTKTGQRKADHIRINLEEDVRSSLTTGLERYRFIHHSFVDSRRRHPGAKQQRPPGAVDR